MRPRRAWDTLLFKGEDFPLVPGYYVLTVTGRGETWYSLLEITPRYMGKQSWQDMGEELLEEIKHLSFDFMKKSIHMSRTLDINPDLLLRFYTISDNSRMVLHVLGELARTANSRPAPPASLRRHRTSRPSPCALRPGSICSIRRLPTTSRRTVSPKPSCFASRRICGISSVRSMASSRASMPDVRRSCRTRRIRSTEEARRRSSNSATIGNRRSPSFETSSASPARHGSKKLAAGCRPSSR